MLFPFCLILVTCTPGLAYIILTIVYIVLISQKPDIGNVNIFFTYFYMV